MSPAVRHAALEALGRYWPESREAVLALPIVDGAAEVALPVRLKPVRLPAWAADCGVDGMLLIPAEAPGEAWYEIDWWWVALWYLQSLAEREHERRAGPIHSYSYRLVDWDGRMWDRAWANRIALFLRRWTAREGGADERQLFGSLPRCEIVVTHDLDAVRKTPSIRFKQSAFHLFNAGRRLTRRHFGDAGRSVARAGRFFIGAEDYRHFERLVPSAAERTKRIIHVYGGGPRGRRTFKDRLFDPSYRIDEPDVVAALRRLAGEGVQIGLHPSFASWADRKRIAEEKWWAEEALGTPITACRQHWLRFSFVETWKAQAACGIERDATLGFNDRPGFRNGAALAFRPGDAHAEDLGLEAWPLVLMDSHLYDYLDLEAEARGEAIARWIGEIKAVGGQATVLWHPHTLGRDYGWGDGFNRMLSTIQATEA